MFGSAQTYLRPGISLGTGLPHPDLELKLITLTLVAGLGLPAFAAAPLTADKVNAATVGPASILRAQILLDRVHFAPGEIDGMQGANMRQALLGYQQAQGLPATGKLDAATWQALGEAPALVAYTIAETDVAGPFARIPEAMADKAALPALSYENAEEALGEKFHASPALLKRLNPGKDLSRAGQEIMVPNVRDAAPLPKGGKIVVDRSDHVLMLVDAAGKTLAQFPASTGSEHDPLPVGDWKVKGIAHNPVFHYNPQLFWDADAGDKKATIPAGPNNPVGVAWIDLSKPHYGIHGTPVPGAIGRTQSHGCIRLSNWDVTELAKAVGAGTDVLLQE